METPLEPRSQQGSVLSRRIWVLLILAALSTSVAAYAWNQGGDTSAAVPDIITLDDLAAGNVDSEDVAPDFSVPTLDGSTFSLYDHLEKTGQPVLLNLWASWCPPCRAEMPAIDEAAARHPNVTFVGVAVQDDPVAAESFAKQIGVSYIIGLDEREEVNGLYSNFGLPMTYVISPQGIILEVMIGEVDGAKIDTAIATWFGG